MTQETSVAGLDARIDRLPVWGLSPALFVVVGLSYFFSFYEVSAYGYALPALRESLGIPAFQSSYPASAHLGGFVIGAYLLGNLADARGRRFGLLVTVLCLSVGGLLCALAWDVWSLTAFRFLTGLGNGGEIVIATSIMSEFSSAARRGRYLQLNYLWGAAGLATTPFLAIFFLRTFPEIGWRLVFGLGGLVALVLLFMRGRYLPESPRWLLLHGYEQEALALVNEMEQTAQQKTGRELPPVPDVPAETATSGVPVSDLFRPPYRSRLLTVFGFWFAWYIAIYAFLGYYPTILIERGLSQSSGILYSALGALAIPVGGLVALLVVDIGQRKYLVSGVAFVLAAALILSSIFTSGFLLWLGGFVASLAIAAGSIGYLYTAEMFPTRVRATATSFGDGLGHTGSIFSPFIVVAALNSWGGSATLIVMAGCGVVAGAILLLGGTSTTGKGLTEIAD